MRAAAWLVLAACAVAAGAAVAGGARRGRRADDDDDDDELDLEPTPRKRPCTTHTGLEGNCVDYSMCDEAHEFLPEGFIDDSEFSMQRCPGRLEWCCSVLNPNVTAIVSSTESSERAKPPVNT